MRDGSQHPLPAEVTERVDTPVVPALAARGDGFVVAWAVDLPSPADGTVLNVATRTAEGEPPGVFVTRIPLDGAYASGPPTLVYAPVDDSVQVLWVEGSPAKVYRERLVCDPFTE
jgi:hypothetical protein